MITIAHIPFPEKPKFDLQQLVKKKSGSFWRGRIVGYYSTKQTPIGYSVQLEIAGMVIENAPVQLYPESALELA